MQYLKQKKHRKTYLYTYKYNTKTKTRQDFIKNNRSIQKSL
jgi:hypothetical protein